MNEFHDYIKDDDALFHNYRTYELQKMLKDAKNNPLQSRELIPIIEKALENRNKKDSERLINYTNFDQSYILINFDEIDSRNTHMGKVLARCHKDHIEIMAKSFIPPMKYLENFIGILNHESIHPVVDRILLEDGFSWGDWDTEWMFYAGGMDLIEGLLYGGASPNQFMSTDAVINTMKLLPEYASALKREYLQGDYDL